MAPQMDLALRDHPVETAVDAAAAAAFAAATAFGVSAFLGLAAAPPGLLAFVPAFYILRRKSGTAETYTLPAFQLVGFPNGGQEVEELLLTAHMMAEPGEDLMLDDVLAQLGPDSRVVRLFDPDQMPTAGEASANIDRPAHFSRPVSNPPDATQALSDALAQLRRSLR